MMGMDTAAWPEPDGISKLRNVWNTSMPKPLRLSLIHICTAVRRNW